MPMTLLSKFGRRAFHLSRNRSLARSLERIADALERAFPSPSTQSEPKHRIDEVTQYDPVADYLAELEEERLRESGEPE